MKVPTDEEDKEEEETKKAIVEKEKEKAFCEVNIGQILKDFVDDTNNVLVRDKTIEASKNNL